MNTIIVLTVLTSLWICAPIVNAGEFWATTDKIFYRVDDDGGWYRSEDAGKTWKMLLAPVAGATKVDEQSPAGGRDMVRLSPNPVSDVLRIELLEGMKVRPVLRLIDRIGRSVELDGRMTTDANGLLAVNVAGLVRGAYTLVIESENSKTSHTIILQ